MASTADFRNGMVLNIDGALWAITYFQHVKPGKGGAFVRTKLKNVLTGAVVEKTYRSGEKVTDVRLERRPVNYSYTDGDITFAWSADSKWLIADYAARDRLFVPTRPHVAGIKGFNRIYMGNDFKKRIFLPMTIP